MNKVIRQSLTHTLIVLALGAVALPVLAGGGSEISEAPYNEIQLNPISMMEAETLVAQSGVYFFDVNTLEIWAEGFIPGAVFSMFKIGESYFQRIKMQSWCFIVPTVFVPPAIWLPERP